MTPSNPPSYEVLLVSTYELGRQPFGLASPAAWLKRAGVSVRCIDLSRERFRTSDFERADFVGFYLPMHTATRLAVEIVAKVSRLNPTPHLCAFGLYAPVNEDYLRGLGIKSILGGEFEQGLTGLVETLRGNEHLNCSSVQSSLVSISLGKQRFLVPDRSSLPKLAEYSKLVLPNGTNRIVGYTEASRGCKHLCRHCPIVPVYQGTFRIVQREIVLADIRQQVTAGAQHITFGDPDFFNGIGHAIPLVRELHGEFPELSYDVTIKIEHLLKHADHIQTLRDTGCAFVTSAVESVDDTILNILDKGHTRADFVRAVELTRDISLPLAPTFVSFTPWLSLFGYEDLLQLIAELDLVSSVAPVQWAIRLLIPNGSRLLELPEVQTVLAGFDEKALSYRWLHPDPRMDALQRDVERLVLGSAQQGLGRNQIFEAILQLVSEAKGEPKLTRVRSSPVVIPCTIPYLTEPWFC